MSMTARQAGVAPEAEAIWREFHERLLGFINRRVRSPEAAEDILQDVMLRIHRNAGGIGRATAIGPWIFAIARNAITDHYRSASVRRETPTEIGIDTGVADELEDESAALGELSACIAPLLSQLPEIYRQALALTEIDGLTQAAAAKFLGLSPSGMKSRVQRARVQLKQVLVQCCEVKLDVRRAVIDYRPHRDSCERGAGESCGCAAN
jgi:RNA polymerase sigma-70 factor, ECF subfamily